MAGYDDENSDACSILVPVNVTDTPGILQSVTAGEGVFTGGGGSYWDVDGVLQTAPPNTRRVTYDPANLNKDPVPLLEPAATNAIRNNTMQGAVAGSPGLSPSYWSIVQAFGAGLTRTIVGKGAEDGIDYIDVRFNGTPSANSTISFYFDGANTISGASGQKFAFSVFAKLVGGSYNGVTAAGLILDEHSAAPAYLANTAVSIALPSSGALRTQRFGTFHTVVNASTAFVQPYMAFTVASGAAVDITLRVGLPQLERDRVTSPIKTTNAAATRAADTEGPRPALAEDPTQAWDAGTTYAAGARRHLLATHRVYESVKDGNVGKLPSDIVNQFNAAGAPTWWIDAGPTNKHAMFDALVSSQTSAVSPLTITLTPGAFNGFALIGIDADSYSVEVLDGPGGDPIYTEPTTPLEGSMPADYYEHFFGRFKPLTQIVRTGIDPYRTAQIKLTLNKADGPVKLGMFAIGDLRPSGIPQRDALVEPQDFSVIKSDGFGGTKVLKRASATGMSITTKMDKEDAGAVLDSLKEVLGVPVVVVGSEAQFYEWMTVFGLLSARMSPSEFPFVTLNMTVRGLT